MKFENTKVLVTGGSGFLGHHMVKALLRRKADVTVFVQPHEKTWRLKTVELNINIVNGKLTNREEIKTVVKNTRPDIMIHFAGWMERRRDLTILEDMNDHHIVSTINLILAANPKLTKLIINTGSSEEYGEQCDPFVETLPADPVSPYSATKAAATSMAIYLSKAIGVPVVTMRPFMVYGPGQLHDTLIPFLIKGILEKRKIELTEGIQYRDFIFVEDLVSCYLAVFERAETFVRPEIFNVGSGKKIAVRDVIDTIADLLNGHDYLKIGARQMRAGEPVSMIADIKKTEKHLGWKPLVGLRDGLKKTIEWWLENEEIWKG